MLVDLLVILPFYVGLMIPSSLDLRVMRVIRLVARLARMERSSHGLRTMGRVVQARSNELISVITVLLVLLLVASSLVFVLENGVQPDDYSSIPETMWWGIITLTTVGYDDVYPVTIAGRLLTGVIAILGIGLFALPAGILGSGFIGGDGVPLPTQRLPSLWRTVTPKRIGHKSLTPVGAEYQTEALARCGNRRRRPVLPFAARQMDTH